MRTKPGMSVIIPCYNTGRYIREAVESVHAQKTSVPYEIIIIDDGSTDAFTHETLVKLKKDYPSICLYYNGVNKGLPATRNVGLEYAQFSHILPLDSDDKLSTDPILLQRGGYIDRTFVAFERDPSLIMAYSRYRIIGAIDHVNKCRPSFDEKTMLSRCLIGAYAVYRREDAMALGGYKTEMRHSEDWFMNIALMNLAVKRGDEPKVHFIEDPLYCYRRNNNGTSMTSKPKMSISQIVTEIMRHNPAIYAKHYPGQAGQELMDSVMADRRAVLMRETKDLFVTCARHPFSSYKDQSWHLAMFEVPRVMHKVLSHFGLAADDGVPAAQGESVHAMPNERMIEPQEASLQ